LLKGLRFFPAFCDTEGQNAADKILQQIRLRKKTIFAGEAGIGKSVFIDQALECLARKVAPSELEVLRLRYDEAIARTEGILGRRIVEGRYVWTPEDWNRSSALIAEEFNQPDPKKRDTTTISWS